MENVSTNNYLTEEVIFHLINGFRNRTLPASQWTHEGHLITGLWFNHTYSDLEAICYLRGGIISYNISSGGENTPEKGYHETLTLFWCKILRHFIVKNKGLSVVELCNAFLNSKWSSKELPLQYYTREILFSVKARAVWVKPNLINFNSEDIFGN